MRWGAYLFNSLLGVPAGRGEGSRGSELDRRGDGGLLQDGGRGGGEVGSRHFWC